VQTRHELDARLAAVAGLGGRHWQQLGESGPRGPELCVGLVEFGEDAFDVYFNHHVLPLE
jgi:hypothetical protein